ncbi:PGF-CTERM protein [Halorubrum trapanicum]|uniref:PGF-CTERM protein n=1 Tax=Halorubrum trapanicum TaxID=29284 RepID=A0A8J7RTC6_9EURY|nr:Hvo_1808 family surface protein [Halorubrum trapanicum]MBP1901402.1 PGF-CTERM protein [Halorubrum trapanicum]
MRRVLTLSTAAAAVAAVAVLCVAFTAGAAAAPDAGSVSAASGGGPAAPGETPSASADECGPGDGTDLVGCWNGTHYEESVDFEETDGLNETQLEALTDLTMARVEHVRQRPFREDVPVETVSRSEYADDTASGGNSSEAFRRWNDQVWRALFVVGDETNANDEIDSVFGGAVSGFYSPAEDRIVIVVPDGESPDIDPSTLAHELLHAMQDQYHDLTDPRYVGVTQDGDLAVDGIVEGEAVHVEERYAARCADNWTCAEAPEGGGGGGSTSYNVGILQTVLQPYGDGALYVRELVDEGGWAAVNETMNDPPGSTAEVIHRDPDYRTSNVSFEDAATDGWETYPDQGVDGAETAGEASMFVMFWYQSAGVQFDGGYEYSILDPERSVAQNYNIHLQTDAQLQTRATYNYAHPVTDGWAGDELYPYRNGDRDGYVWATEWQTEADAAAFRDAYVRMLTAHGDGDYADETVYTIGDDSDFPGAYGVERDGTSVTITHAPSPEGVLELRPDADLALPDTDGADGSDGGDGGDDGDGSGDGGDGSDADGGENESDGGDGSDDGDDGDDNSTGNSAPGFGVGAALVALVAALGLSARRAT